MRYSTLLLPALLPALLLTAACASSPEPAPRENPAGSSGVVQNTGSAAGSAYTQTKDGIPDAAMSPLEDLNLKRDPIPPILQGIKSPYDVPEDISCSEITLTLAQLDAALGPDWDTEDPDERLRTEKLADEASDAALDTISSTASSLIPFRSLVRRATGAYAYQKKYNRAYKIGAQHRAYLKGIGLARGCPLPARPAVLEPEPDDMIFKGDTPD
ncbi:hypothetical protein [uncultured Hyphomonas sp.]|uniref:hypothetical protein n=1 Tax=uncultured Hyphomonas sp. TaxID=225298 RepID=UPI002AABF46C|nr:hypothetical protein [uncultured Hyphomonas sp.]